MLSCFCSASLKVLVSNRRYVIFLTRDFKIGGRQKHVWDRLFREVAGKALEHIHSCEFTRNDLNSDVVSEWREGQPSPVIIDFVKSVLAEKAKVPMAKAKHIRSHFSYIAPELRNGTAKPSVSSDIYSLAFMIKSLYKMLNGTVQNALKEISDNRPSLLSDSLNWNVFLFLIDRLSCDLPYFSFVSHFAIKKRLEDCNCVFEKRL